MNRHIPERGFTLIELLVTMGLMALLATVSIAGYYGAVRGMTERGVKQDVVAFVRNAQQRAMVEQTPTAVFFMNRYLREDDEALGEVSRVVGVAVAVRMAGRISYISKAKSGGGGVCLADEYADLDKSYPTNAITGQPVSKSNMRLYRMCTDANSFEQSYSLVEDQVVQAKATFNRDDLLNTVDNPASDGVLTYNDTDIETSVKNSVWAFRVAQQNTGLDGSRWRVGDPYGTEIATLQLPHGYVFGSGSGLPTSVGDTKGVGKPQFFDPGTLSATTVKGSKFSFDTIAISAFRPGSDSPKKFDSVSKSDLDDDSKD